MELQEIVELIRPKVKKLGLNQKEVEKLSKTILSTLAEDATSEDAEKAIDGVLPYLELAQSQANRVIEAARKKAEQQKAQTKKTDGEEDGDDEDDDDEGDGEVEQKQQKNKKPTKKADNAIMNYLKKMEESLNERFAKLESRESEKVFARKMKERFKDIDPEFYQMAAEGRTFNSEDEFEDFATKVEENWGKYSQKLANEGLSRMAKPKGGGAPPKEGELSEELKARIAERQNVKTTSVIRGLEDNQQTTK